MSQCPRCSKRVFFAERKNSLGKDWHRQCLTCEACSKVLNPGQHAEHKSIPYCHSPCYKKLFGPNSHGFGSQSVSQDHSPKLVRQTEHIPNDLSVVAGQNKTNISMSSPRMDGRSPKRDQQQIKELEEKLKIHNDVHPQNFISLIEKDGHVTLEGLLRVHWGVQTTIQFKKDDSHETTSFTARLRTHRIAKTRSFHSELYAHLPEEEVVRDPFQTLKSSGVPPEISSQQLLAVKMKRGQFHTIREQKVKRRCSINGHYYRNERSSNDFTPAFGSVTQVFVGSHLRTQEVIKRLLDKFKIENNSSEFALYMVKLNGEMWPLGESDYPLNKRVAMVDPSARIFLMDKPHHMSITASPEEEDEITSVDDKSLASATIADIWKRVDTLPHEKDTSQQVTEVKKDGAVVMREKIPHELAGFLCLPEPMLIGFIAMFDNEQKIAAQKIRDKYDTILKHITMLMTEKQLTQETYL